MKSILVATDLSERSEPAVARAFALAEQQGASVTLLHVTDADLPREIAVAQQHEAQRLLNEAAARRPELVRRVEAAIADPIVKIVDAVEAEDADLLVLGVHRLRPLMDMIASTTMERIVSATRRPALVVASPPAGPYARPLCGVDLSPACAAAAHAVAALAPAAEIESFFAYHAPFQHRGDDPKVEVAPFLAEAQGALDQWMAQTTLPPQFRKPLPALGGVRAVLERALAETRADLLAVGAHGRSGFALSPLGSFTASLLRRPLCDTLVIRG